jgi:molybdopterin-containing oxidoreductase family iron-sulfur binding subunit
MSPTPPPSRKDLDWVELRERLAGRQGRALWRSLEELADTAEFAALVEREFPEQAAEWPDEVSRRRFLQLMSASLALGGLAACTRQPLERIVPYVQQPEQIVPGKPLFFATSMTLGGYALGLLAESHMGRPTKLEGNPEHPASLGATDLFAQASVLDLYDPDRAQTVTHNGRIGTWEAFAAEIAGARAALAAAGGMPLRVLTGAVTSPTLAALLQRLLAENPRARWHIWEPTSGEGNAGLRMACGEGVHVRYDFSRVRVALALDADFLTQGPGAVRYARDFLAGRRVHESGDRFTRLYAVESTPTATGTIADHRWPMATAEIGRFALEVAAALGVGGGTAQAGEPTVRANAVATDLAAHRGASAVVAGDQAPAALHALALAMNARLGNLGSTVLVSDPVEARPADGAASLAELVASMQAGEVDTLLVLGGNPAYDGPADLGFAEAMFKVPRRIHLSSSANETSARCHWTLPETHYLESWGDARAFDGTVSLVQPLIEPLYGGRSAIEVVSIFTADGGRDGEELLRAQWQGKLSGADPEKAWRQALHDGFIAGSSSPHREVAIGDLSSAIRALAEAPTASAERSEVVFRPDPTIWDGRFANNGWLQECPKPLTKLTWDNAALVAPALAQRLGLANGQWLELEVDGRRLQIPTWIHPGQAEHTVTVHLGYGRRQVGRVGRGTGFDAYAVRGSAGLWQAPVAVRAGRGHHPLATTQLHHNIDTDPRQGTNLEGREAGRRHLVRVGTLERYAEEPEFARHVGHGAAEEASLYPAWSYEGRAWGMSIDLGSCTGCNACVVACQAENNVPVVGKEQVARGREMHWLRVDRYYEGALEAPRVHHQPVLCMHCEQAPCEVVCPVAATVHSDEGLNDMVYNRCVGTRYCSNNCPYKVRRFNFLKYADTETPVLRLLRNPDVTVRSRGVMEKCTYCVQRINAARIDADREGRPIRDGEVVTACQQACPTAAIVFGDCNDPTSAVAQRKREPLAYGLLTELGTRPRTTYLAKLVNPNPALGAAAEEHAG